MSAIIAGLIRHAMALAGAMWAGSDAEIGEAFRSFVEHLASGDGSTIGGSAITLIAIAWSIYDKKKKTFTKEKSNELDD